MSWPGAALLAVVLAGVFPAAVALSEDVTLSSEPQALSAATVESGAAAAPGETPIDLPTSVNAGAVTEAAEAPASGARYSNEVQGESSDEPALSDPREDPGMQQPADDEPSSAARSDSAAMPWPESLGRWIDTDRLAGSAQLGLTLMVLGFIPALFLMTTAYLRITIVLSVLRQAFGSQLLPMQATTALSLLCTALVMWPTWTRVYEKGMLPGAQGVDPIELVEFWQEGIEPIREFMIRQIKARGGAEDVHLFLRQVATADEYPTSYEEVPLRVLLPAFVISELKAAFLIGFQIYLPFLVIDLVVATLTTSMGMFMLPPGMVSLPLKLLLFVLVDGWRLIVEMLLSSFP